MFVAILFTVAQEEKQPKCPVMDEQVNTTTITYNGILFRLQKKGKSDICYNMDEPWGHYGKRNKPVTKGQRRYDSSQMRFLE